MKKPRKPSARQLARRQAGKQRQRQLAAARAEKTEERQLHGVLVKPPVRDAREKTSFGQLAMALERRSQLEMLMAA